MRRLGTGTFLYKPAAMNLHTREMNQRATEVKNMEKQVVLHPMVLNSTVERMVDMIEKK